MLRFMPQDAARDVAKVLGSIALQASTRGQPFAPPCILLSGGETTVTVRGEGYLIPEDEA